MCILWVTGIKIFCYLGCVNEANQLSHVEQSRNRFTACISILGLRTQGTNLQAENLYN